MPLKNEQQESKDFFYQLEICCRQVAEKFGQPETDRWLNGDYIKLSSVLFRKTAVQISPSTLKRIFGKLKTPERYYPQKATRDALANYAGYSNWDDFVVKHPRPLQKIKATELPEDAVYELRTKQVAADMIPFTMVQKKQPVSRYRVIGFAAVIVLLIVVVVLVRNKRRPEIVSLAAGKATLLCSKPEGETPHSTTFKILLEKGTEADPAQFTIDYGDGKKPWPLLPDQTVSHFYEVPGRYYAVLRYNQQPCDTIPVYLRTKGWTATVNVQHDTTRVYPVDLPDQGIDGHMKVYAPEIHAAGVDTNRTFFVDFVNTQPFDISGDNFELSVRVVTSPPRPGVRCSQADINVFGEKTQHKAIFIKPGCVNWSFVQFAEVKHEGGQEDLHFMGADLTEGGTIKLLVVHQKAALFVNNKKIYETVYQYPLGKIFGVKISFAGVGSINGFNLKDLRTGIHFSGGLALSNP